MGMLVTLRRAYGHGDSIQEACLSFDISGIEASDVVAIRSDGSPI